MPGYFNKAPLVYVTARFHTTGLPILDNNQINDLQKHLLKIGLSELKLSDTKTITLDSAINDDSSPVMRTEKRYGFFDVKREKSLVLSPKVIEFRCTRYLKYKNFINEFGKALQSCFDAIPDFLPRIGVKESVLSYSDIICPYNGRSLSDYFQSPSSILPLNFLENHKSSDLVQAGTVQASRVLKEDLKLDILLEQLTNKGITLSKFLPNSMMEPSPDFSMPLHMVLDEWRSFQGEYGLLLTRASKLASTEIGSIKLDSEFDELHKLTSDTFHELINKDVCYADWEYNK